MICWTTLFASQWKRAPGWSELMSVCGTYTLWRTHQPQWGSLEPKHSPQVVYCSQLSTGTLTTYRDREVEEKRSVSLLSVQNETVHSCWISTAYQSHSVSNVFSQSAFGSMFLREEVRVSQWEVCALVCVPVSDSRFSGVWQPPVKHIAREALQCMLGHLTSGRGNNAVIDRWPQKNQQEAEEQTDRPDVYVRARAFTREGI